MEYNLMGIMALYSINDNTEYSWVCGTNIQSTLKKIKHANKKDKLVIHKIRPMSYDDFINYIENIKG